jgi:sugar (pentulose or hexulose) kinase
MSAAGPLLVAVDVGTTGARAVAIDLAGAVVAEVRRPYRTHTPHPGWAEQDAGDWAEHAVSALRGLAVALPQPERVAGVGLTGQCPTVAPVGADGRQVGPGMLYRDNRAVAEAAEMRAAMGVDAMHARTGHVAQAFHIGPKLLWLRRHQPRVYAAARQFLQPRDVVLRRLTGRVATDESHADATMFFDLRERRWADDIFARFDVDPGLFPEALPPWATAAELPAAAAAETGLPAGIPVVIGAGDSQCVAFGAGVVDPGPASEMAGASSCLNSAVIEPLADVRVTHYSHVVPDRFTTELGINTSGAAIDWAVRRLGYAGHAALAADAERLRRRLRRTRADARDVAPLFLPYLGDGERDDPALRGAFVGLSLRHDRPALAYAVLEGIAFGVHGALRELEAAGSPVEELRVAGGGGRLPVLSQIKADVLGRPVLALRADAAATGTALLAARPAGLADEAAAAVAAVLAAARRYEPSAGSERLAARLQWYEHTRAAAAMRQDWSDS